MHARRLDRPGTGAVGCARARAGVLSACAGELSDRPSVETDARAGRPFQLGARSEKGAW